MSTSCGCIIAEQATESAVPEIKAADQKRGNVTASGRLLTQSIVQECQMIKHIVVVATALSLALAAQSASWAQTSGTDTSVSGSSKMGTKAGSHNTGKPASGHAAKSQKMRNSNNGQ
jgi:hypothetical protein